MAANSGDSVEAVVKRAPNGVLPEVEAMMAFGALGFHYTGLSHDDRFAYATRYVGDFVDLLTLVLDPEVAKTSPSGCERHERRLFPFAKGQPKPDPLKVAVGTMEETLRQVEEWAY